MTRQVVIKVSRLGLATLGALLLGGCGGHEPRERPAASPALPVQLATATLEPSDDGLEVSASVQPLLRATPGTVLMGRVEEILHGEGDRITRGQVLARIESRDVTARLAQAEAAVAAARAMEHNARLMKERMERLYSRQAASRKNLDDALAGHEAALANLEAAEEGVNVARVFRDYSEVRAPFSGRIVEKRIEVGDTAAPGMPLFVVEDVTKVKIEAQVPVSAGSALALGDAVDVEVQGERLEASVSELVPAADPRSRTFTVRALLANPDGRLRSGMFARMRLRGEKRSVVRVGEAAVVRRGPLTGVFVVGEDNVARLRWVTLGRLADSGYEVLTGLDAGERVVARPAAELEDGRAVEVR